MAKATSFSPLRFLTPGQLVICVVLFFLPWIQLSCTLPPEAKEDKAELEKFRKETGVDPTKPVGMVDQSGLQIATGDSSLASDWKKITDKLKKEADAGGVAFKMEEDPSKKKKDSAPFLFLYPVALVAGIVFGVIPWVNPARKWITFGCCLLAFGVLGLQLAIGFPLERELKKENEKLKSGGLFGAEDGKGKSGAKEPDIFRVRWKLPLYLSLLLPLGAAGTALLGDSVPAKRPKRRRYRDEDDEEDEQEVLSLDEDEPEERPRRRRPREEDDTRRRRRRDEDEDEE